MAALVIVPKNPQQVPISIESLRYSYCINLDKSTSNSLRFSLDSHSHSGYFDLNLDLDLDLGLPYVASGPHDKVDSQCPSDSMLMMRKKGVFKRLIGLILRPLGRMLRGGRRMNSKVGVIDDDRNNRIKLADRYCGSYCDRETQIREAVLHCKKDIRRE